MIPLTERSTGIQLMEEQIEASGISCEYVQKYGPSLMSFLRNCISPQGIREGQLFIGDLARTHTPGFVFHIPKEHITHDYSTALVLSARLHRDDPTGHNFLHILQTSANAWYIHTKEKIGRPRNILFGTLFHDIHRRIEHVTGIPCKGEDSIPVAKLFLLASGVPEDEHPAILTSIAGHDNRALSRDIIDAFSEELDPDALKVLQDADRLEVYSLDRLMLYGISNGIGFRTSTNGYRSSLEYLKEVILHEWKQAHTETGKQMALWLHNRLEQTLVELGTDVFDGIL